jgi:NADPH-dependent F420 reductase
MSELLPRIAIVGGTGALGGGLAFRWARRGYKVVIGSRSVARSEAAADVINARLETSNVSGSDYVGAAESADIIVVAVPFSTHSDTMHVLRDVAAGKIVLDTTVPLVPPKVSRVQISDYWPAAGSAQKILGEQVKVVSAFHNVAAAHLQEDVDGDESDVLVFGNDPTAREAVIELVQATGHKGWHAGPIDNSVVGEALTSVLIFINKRYGIKGSGIKVTGSSE